MGSMSEQVLKWKNLSGKIKILWQLGWENND
jgi:hypothetical protein